MILSTTARHRHFQDWILLVLPTTLAVMEGLCENTGTSNSVGPNVQRWEETNICVVCLLQYPKLATQVYKTEIVKDYEKVLVTKNLKLK